MTENTKKFKDILTKSFKAVYVFTSDRCLKKGYFAEPDLLKLCVFKEYLMNEVERVTRFNDSHQSVMSTLRFLIDQKQNFLPPDGLPASNQTVEQMQHYKDFLDDLDNRLVSLINEIFLYFQSLKFQDPELDQLKRLYGLELISMDESIQLVDDLDKKIDELQKELTKNVSFHTASQVSKKITELQQKYGASIKLIPLKLEANLVAFYGKPTDGLYRDYIHKYVILYLEKADSVQLKVNFFKLILNKIVALQFKYDLYLEFRNDCIKYFHTNKQFWFAICDFELYNCYIDDKWKTSAVPNKISTRNLFCTLDCFCTNHLNEIAEIYQFIDLIILEYFSERHKNTEIEKNKLAEVYEIFEGCAYLSENRYAIYIQEFCSSNTFNEDVKTVALRSIKLHKQSLALYKLCMTVLFELNDFEMLNKVTNAAFHHLPKDDQWSIIMHNIVLVLLHNDSKFEDVERLYLQSTKIRETYISHPMSAMYLRWIDFHQAIHDTRQFYDSYIQQNVTNIRIVEEMLDIESGYRPKDKDRLIALYEYLIFNSSADRKFLNWIAEYYYFLDEIKCRVHIQELFDTLKAKCPIENLARFNQVGHVQDILDNFDFAQNYRITVNEYKPDDCNCLVLYQGERTL